MNVELDVEVVKVVEAVEVAEDSDLGYFIKINEIYETDTSISDILGIKVKEYQNVFINNFNAYIELSETYFENKEDAKVALAWVESIIMSNKLRGD